MGESKDNIIEFGAEQATGIDTENMPAEAAAENAIETAEAREETWTMSGLSEGRPFVVKMERTEEGRRASAPSP